MQGGQDRSVLDVLVNIAKGFELIVLLPQLELFVIHLLQECFRIPATEGEG